MSVTTTLAQLKPGVWLWLGQVAKQMPYHPAFFTNYNI